MGMRLYLLPRWGWGWDKSLIPVGFGYGDGDEFFMREWVWDSETCPRPAPSRPVTIPTPDNSGNTFP